MFRKKTEPVVEQKVIGQELALTTKDLSLCLYEEYQKVDKLKMENEKLREQVNQGQALATDNRTQLVVINELQAAAKASERKIEKLEVDVENWKNKVNEAKSEAALARAEANKLMEAKVEERVQSAIGIELKSGAFSNGIRNDFANKIIALLQEKPNWGKHQIIKAVEDLLALERVTAVEHL
jgi:predicted  nucleic acid-binding Zn-ribbon protein